MSDRKDTKVVDDKKNDVGSNQTSVNVEKKLPEKRVLNTESETIKRVIPKEKVEIDSSLIKEVKNEMPVDSSKNTNKENNDEGTSFFQKLMAIIIFGILFVFIYFLPTIAVRVMTGFNWFNKEEKITTGVLTCTLDKTSGNLEHGYELNFIFMENKLTRLGYLDKVSSSKSDDVELNNLYNSCSKTMNAVNELNGVDTMCNFENGILTQKQVFNYEMVNRIEVKSTYVENGGIYPEFSYKEDMDNLEKKMNADGYSCKRHK